MHLKLTLYNETTFHNDVQIDVHPLILSALLARLRTCRQTDLIVNVRARTRTMTFDRKWGLHGRYHSIKNGADTDKDIRSRMVLTLHGQRYLIRKIADVDNICSRKEQPRTTIFDQE